MKFYDMGITRIDLGTNLSNLEINRQQIINKK